MVVMACATLERFLMSRGMSAAPLANRKLCSLRASCLGCVVLASTACSLDDGSKRGRELLAQHHCGSCHVIPGVPAAQGRVAVTLEAFGRRSYIAGRVPNSDANLARWLVEPASLVPGTLMPAMGVSPADAREMAAYLRGLR
jgi:cytochrome c2